MKNNLRSLLLLGLSPLMILSPLIVILIVYYTPIFIGKSDTEIPDISRTDNIYLPCDKDHSLPIDTTILTKNKKVSNKKDQNISKVILPNDKDSSTSVGDVITVDSLSKQ